VNASGTDIESTSDQFRFVFEPWTGDGTVVAKVTSIENTNAWAKGGVMIRESLAANSKHAMMVLTPGHGLSFQRRLSTGGSTVSTGGPFVAAPYWVKVVRSGSTLSGYGSPDGVNWTLVGSDTISMAAGLYVGIPLTSHDNTQLCTATFGSVSATGSSSTPTPTRTPTRTPTPSGAVIRIEAESPTLTSPMVKSADPNAFGGWEISTSVTDSGTAAWTFTAPTVGTYYVWGRVLSPDAQHDSFYVKMDSGAEDVYDTSQGIWQPYLQWTRVNGRGTTGIPLTLNPRTFSLSAGSHTLTFRGREAGTILDRVIVTNDSTFVPTEAP
jgi:hypothetical protein